MVGKMVEKSIYEGWKEIDEELSYGIIGHWSRDGYTVAEGQRGWSRVYNPGETRKFALYLPDGSLLRSKQGSVTTFDDAYNAVNRANKLVNHG